MKRLQNRIAESGTTLLVAGLYAVCVWTIAMLHGSTFHILLPQLTCFIASVYLIVELSNGNALLRIRNRMVSSTFIVLSCMYICGFDSLLDSATQLGFIVTILLLFKTYQDPQATGRTYYAFLSLGLCSLVYAQLLYLVPLLWILMFMQLQSLSWRTLSASVLGIITPVWFASLWLIYQQDYSPMTDHLSDLFAFETFSESISAITIEQILVYSFLLCLTMAGIIHFWHYSYEDKIRIRQLFSFFTVIVLITLTAIALQPQHFHWLIRIAIVCSSPIVAHFLTMTSSRASNIAFFVIIALSILITAFNLWMFLSIS